MSFIYHMVPKEMIGDTLVPLQSLRDLSEERYGIEIKKYDDHPKRKELPCRILKKLNDPIYLKDSANNPVSLLLPLRPEPYIEKTMIPFFDGLIPEGWLLNIAETNWKLDRKDRMSLLLALCNDCIVISRNWGGHRLHQLTKNR